MSSMKSSERELRGGYNINKMIKAAALDHRY
jgi:hypothetical protein